MQCKSYRVDFDRLSLPELKNRGRIRHVSDELMRWAIRWCKPKISLHDDLYLVSFYQRFRKEELLSKLREQGCFFVPTPWQLDWLFGWCAANPHSLHGTHIVGGMDDDYESISMFSDYRGERVVELLPFDNAALAERRWQFLVRQAR